MSDALNLLHRAVVEASDPAAGRIARALDEAETPQALSVSFFERGNGMFEITALYSERPSADALAALIEDAADGDTFGAFTIEPVPDADWVRLSQGQRGPVRAGRFLVHGSHDRQTVTRNRYTIEIDADQAFGTAHHATTRGCLLALDALAKQARPDLALDLGTGSGILAIAAALAFDRPVVATDNDPVAVEIAEENVRKAGVRSLVHVHHAEGLADPLLMRLAPDLIVANILAGPLDALAPAMAQTVAPGGYVLLSGLTSDQAGPIVARYCALGFCLERRILLDGWATVLLGLRT